MGDVDHRLFGSFHVLALDPPAQLIEQHVVGTRDNEQKGDQDARGRAHQFSFKA